MQADLLLRNMVVLFHLLPKIEEDLIKYAYLHLNQILHKKIGIEITAETFLLFKQD